MNRGASQQKKSDARKRKKKRKPKKKGGRRRRPDEKENARKRNAVKQKPLGWPRNETKRAARKRSAVVDQQVVLNRNRVEQVVVVVAVVVASMSPQVYVENPQVPVAWTIVGIVSVVDDMKAVIEAEDSVAIRAEEIDVPEIVAALGTATARMIVARQELQERATLVGRGKLVTLVVALVEKVYKYHRTV